MSTAQKYYALLTQAGQAAMVRAAGFGETIRLTHMAVGDGNGTDIAPTQEMTALVNEVYRAPINALAPDDDVADLLVADIIIPHEIGGWTASELGIYDADGNLFAIASVPPTYKPTMLDGGTTELHFRMLIALRNADKIELIVDPTVILASREYVNQQLSAVKIPCEKHVKDKGNPHEVTWGQTKDKPVKFPPEAHSHSVTDISGLSAELQGATPVGLIELYTMTTIPPRRLKANGAALSRTTYADLFAAIGTTYGAGDGVSTFNIPDLRGEFIRGWDDGRGIDSGRALGSAQDDDFKGHHHVEGRGTNAGGRYGNSNTGLAARSCSPDSTNTHGYNTSTVGGAETRPRNVALVYTITY